MSAGPIRQERQAHAAPLVSTTAKATRATSWVAVTCADCRAARAADEAVR